MNEYEIKQEEKKQRYLDRAEQLRIQSEQTLDRARQMASVIPFGQPILVGHHSERRDRNFRNRIHDTYGRGFEAAKKADYYEQKAASVGKGGISSDDPEAVVKLREKLANLENTQALYKAINAAHKKFLKDPASLDKSDLSEASKDIIRNYQPRYSWEPHPIAPYQLTNNSAEIRRCKKRIEELGAKAELTDASETIGEIEIRQDVAENRVMIIFPGKPSEEIRTLAKRNGFKWSPTRGAWVRMLSAGALWNAREVAKAAAGITE